MAGGVPCPVRARVTGGRFSIDLDTLEAAASPRAKCLLLNTPWNPVGTVLTEAEVAALTGFAERRDLILLSDEIYEAIIYDGRFHVSPARLARDRTVLINSLSKTYAMTGWRAGYCAAPRHLIDSMLLVLQQSSRGPAQFVQDAAAVALDGPQQCVAGMREEYTRRRALVLDRLAGIPGADVLPPEGGFFAMLDLRSWNLPSDQVRRRLLNEQGVVVVHGAAYGQGGEGTLRVSFASGGAALDRGLELLRQGLVRFTE
ncbi:MAG: aminotransferase class I/II-fold pyridoxal phosphate-dependent enzyme [Gemmatimonadetes bacterium]|nr:aminotransferase class I/II-fold pyridoxal phosphate-dependent enzyme [Gemmatimonadota bacterium]